MSEDANILIGAELVTDKGSFKEGEAALKKLTREAKLKQAAKDAALFASETGDVVKAQKKLIASLKEFGDVSEQEAKRALVAFEKFEAQQRKMAAAPSAQQKRAAEGRSEKAFQAGEQFDVTRKNVELAGDFETQVRTLGGALDAAGLERVGQLGLVAGELGAVTEALPLLKDSLKGLPAAAKSAFNALGGIGGVGLIGGIGLAAVAFQHFTAEANKTKKALDEQIKAQKEFNRSVSQLTSEGLEDRRRTLEESLAFELSEKERQTADLQQALAEGAEFGEISVFLANLAETEKEIETLTGQIEQLGDASDENAAMVADQRQAMLEQASAAADTVRINQEVVKGTEEQNRARLEGLQEDMAQRRAELAILQQSGDTSQETTDRIRALTDELDALGRESDIVANDLNSGAAAARDAAAAAKEAAEEQAESAKRIADAHKGAADAVAKAGENLNKKLADIARNRERSLEDAARKNAEARQKLQDKFNEDQEKNLESALQKRQETILNAQRADAEAAEKLRSDLNKIRDKSNKDQLSAIEKRDFLAFAKARQTEKEEQQKAVAKFEEDKARRAVELAQTLSDQQNAFIQQRNDAIKANAQARKDLQKSLKQRRAEINRAADQRIDDARRAQAAEIAQARKALQEKLQAEAQYWQQSMGLIPGGGGSSLGAPTTNNSSSINATFNNNFSSAGSAAASVGTILSVIQGHTFGG
jgi:hypothetical protein